MKFLPVFLMISLLASCAFRPANPFLPAPDAPTWPLPPDSPRVRHIRSFSEHQDLFLTGNFFTRMIDFVFGTEEIRMVRPHGLAMHPDGGVLITDPGMGRVHFFDIPRRRYRMLGEDLPGGLPSPVGVAVKGDGEILVSDSRLRSIERFERSGAHLGKFAPDHVFQRPGGIVVDPASGNVYIADILGHCILAFDPGGRLLRSSGGNGVLPGLYNFPTHLGITPGGTSLLLTA
jgi:DNA-binding beta-propeller fold protein YncE